MIKFIFVFLFLLPSISFADDLGWKISPDGMSMNQNMVNSNIDPTWSSQVGKITGITGIHKHEIGEDSCRVTRNSNIKKFNVNKCIIHVDGIESRFATITAIFPNFSTNESRVFIGYSSTTIKNCSDCLIQQELGFSDEQRKRIIPLARIQAAKGQLGANSDISDLGITDLRPITETFEKNVLLWVKNFNGPLIKSGFTVTENLTTTRQLDISAGTFSDEELVSHTTGVFTAITGLTLYHTALGNQTTTLDVIRVDNVNYDTATGLVPMTNNNWYAAHNLMMSPETNGRPPRFAVVYSQTQYSDVGAAETAAFDLGPFLDATPRWVPLAKIIVKKNTDTIIGIQDARPINASGIGTGSFLPTSLQGAYNASPNTNIPEITTNDQHNALTIRHGGTGVNPLTLETQLDDGRVVFGAYTTYLDIAFSNGSSVQFDDDTTAGNTRFILYDVDNGKMERVSVGAADSGGAGFKVLRIQN